MLASGSSSLLLLGYNLLERGLWEDWLLPLLSMKVIVGLSLSVLLALRSGLQLRCQVLAHSGQLTIDRVLNVRRNRSRALRKIDWKSGEWRRLRIEARRAWTEALWGIGDSTLLVWVE